MRTARSTTSGENFGDFLILAPFSIEGASSKDGAVHILVLGVVSLFADMTYEGARSINGPYLAGLGATGMVVGIVAGAGELIGYALRYWSGRMVDRTHRYWPIVLVATRSTCCRCPRWR
jgi:hypothetical protein